MSEPVNKELDDVVKRVQHRLRGFGTPPDKERIKAIVSVLTVHDWSALLPDRNFVVCVYVERNDAHGPTYGPYTEDEAKAVVTELTEGPGWSSSDEYTWEHDASADQISITRMSVR